MDQRVEHFSHVHPLLLKEEHKKDGKQVSCSGCEKTVSGPAYCCNQCNYVLHKSCIELPLKVKHPLHPQHPLSLLSTSPYAGSYICDACRGIYSKFVYHCSLCGFDLDIACGSTWHPDDGHNHAFISLNSSKPFVCYACGKEGSEGLACLCIICQIWVHSSCAEVPQTIIKHCHHHPLKLTYSLHDVYGFRDDITCGACNGTMSSSLPGYFCSACKFPMHLKCPEKRKEDLETVSEKDEHHEDETHVSEDDEDQEDETHVSDDDEDQEDETRVSDDDKDQEDETHVSEDEGDQEDETHVSDDNEDQEDKTHVSDDEESNVGSSETEQSQSSEDIGLSLFSHEHLLKFMEELSLECADKLCGVCVQPITPPLFSCSENCGFLLHQSCAELPRTKQHRFHPHPLTLLSKAPPYDGIYRCDGCKSVSNGFVYRCDECQFDLDVFCGSLMDKVKHESHKHPLSLEKTSIARECKGCHLRSKHVLVCDVCDDFAIDCGCANLPSKAWHKCDKHLLSLIYNVKGDLREHNCGICKEKRSPNQWFYYCDDCDFGAHPCCVLGKYRGVKFGGTFQYDAHAHPLALVEELRKHPPCEACGEGCNGWTLECGQCKCYFHREGQCFLEQFKQSAKYLALSGTMRHKYAANVLAATPNATNK